MPFRFNDSDTQVIISYLRKVCIFAFDIKRNLLKSKLSFVHMLLNNVHLVAIIYSAGLRFFQYKLNDLIQFYNKISLSIVPRII
jgi:hypothetical protein